jgi:hypothetical protein
MAEVFGPPDLATCQGFRRREVFQILVVRDNVDRKGRSLEIVTPLSKSVEYRQEFFVVRVVVEFRGPECPGPERNRVDVTVVAEDG